MFPWSQEDDFWWVPVERAAGPIDWDCDGNYGETDVQYDVNGRGGGSQVLSNRDDWPYLVFSFPGGPIGQDSFGVAPSLPMTSSAIELTDVDAARVLPLQRIDLDVRPGSDVNPVRCGTSQSIIPAAILSTDGFNALTVDERTVRLAGAPEVHRNMKTDGLPQRHEKDIDGDGDLDLVFHFRLGDTALTCESTIATLTGLTFDHILVEGSDTVSMLP